MGRVARVAAVEVVHVGLAGAVGLVEVALGRRAVDSPQPHPLLDPRLLRPGQPHVQRVRLIAQHDRAGTPEDHGAFASRVLAQHLLGRLPERLVGQKGLGHGRRAGEHRRDLAERQQRAHQPAADRLVAVDRLAQRDGEPLGHTGGDRAVDEPHAQPLRDRWADLAAAGAVGR